jgi:hypothetical protein
MSRLKSGLKCCGYNKSRRSTAKIRDGRAQKSPDRGDRGRRDVLFFAYKWIKDCSNVIKKGRIDMQPG